MICIGPISKEVVDVVYKISHDSKTPYSLIASKNQIDHNGGYVNQWNTESYTNYLKQKSAEYPEASVQICRDHCGPGFNGTYHLKDVYATIRNDIECGFDLIHMDFCHFSKDKKLVIKETLHAIDYALKLNPNISFEIGTDEISETTTFQSIKTNVEIFSEFSPVYCVINSGSLVKDMHQIGKINLPLLIQAKAICNDYGLQTKEHNVDYSTAQELIQRKNLIDAINIAPELGIIQTKTVLECAEKFGIDSSAFIQASYDSGKWSKWIYRFKPDDIINLAIMAGHYNYNSKEYKDLCDALYKKIDIELEIHNALSSVIQFYRETLYAQ